MAKRFTLENVAGFIKHCQGMCADEEPHFRIWEELQNVLKMLRRTKEFKAAVKTRRIADGIYDRRNCGRRG